MSDVVPAVPAKWSSLTRMPEKVRAFRRETWFREGLHAADQTLGSSRDLVLHRGASMLLKPDGIAAGHVPEVLSFLEDNGFSLAGAHRIEFSGVMWRELWRYQLTAASIDRLLLNDLILDGDAVLLTLRDEQHGTQPGSVRLSKLKGSADHRQRRPGTLRDLIGQPHRVFSSIHVADEPADLVREVAILFSRGERPTVFGSLAAPHTESVRTVLNLLDVPKVPWRYEPKAAAQRVREWLARMPDSAETRQARETIVRTLDAVRASVSASWPDFLVALDAFDRSGPAVDRWDVAAIGAALIETDDPGEPKVIDNPDPISWTGDH